MSLNSIFKARQKPATGELVHAALILTKRLKHINLNIDDRLYTEKMAIQSLLERGADINEVDGQGFTALMWATHHDRIDVVRLLLGGGADIYTKNIMGYTALNIAEAGNHPEIAQLIHAVEQIITDAAQKRRDAAELQHRRAVEAEEKRIDRVASPAVLSGGMPAPKLFRPKQATERKNHAPE